MSLLLVLLSFPTVVFSVLLAVSLVYWLFVLIGALDHDALGGGDDAIDALGSHVEGAAHLHVEVAADLGDAGGADLGDLPSPGLFASFFAMLRLRSVPLTVVISLFAIFGFLLTGLAAVTLGSLPWFASIPVLIGASFASLLATSVAIRPLGGLFKTHRGTSHADLVGRVLVVSTSEVTATFGQADWLDHGESLSLPVRAEAEAGLRRGDRCLVIEYDEARGHFSVVPFSDGPERGPRRIATQPTATEDFATTDDVIAAQTKRRR